MALTRNLVSVGGATLLSRLLAFARDMAIAAVLGAGGIADALFVALQIPNLLRRLLAEGALNAAFVPLWLRRRDDGGETAARRFSEDILGTLSVVLAAAAVVCTLFAPAVVALLAPGFATDVAAFAAYFLRLCAPYIAIVGPVAVLAASLNAAGRVDAAAYGPIVFNIVMIGAAVALIVTEFERSLRSGVFLAAAVVVAGLAQLLMVAVATARLPSPPHLPQFGASAPVRRFYRLLLPGLIAAALPQLTLIAGTIIASASPAAVSWLTYAFRLYELPLGVIAAAIAAVITPALAAHRRAGDGAAEAAEQAHALQLALGLALPAAVGLILLAQPIVAALFERGAFTAQDTAAVATALTAVAIGIPGHALEKTLAAFSFAREDTRTPMLTALAGLVVAVVAAVLLFPRHGHAGVAAAVASSGYVSAAALAAVLRGRGALGLEPRFWRRAALIVLATAVMGTSVGILDLLLSRAAAPSSLPTITVLAILIVFGIAVYVGALRLFGIADIKTLRDPVQDRPR